MAERVKVKLDNTDRGLLNRLQADFPLTVRPFSELGKDLGLSEKAVIRRVRRLEGDGLIRCIGPIFDPHRLGYRSTLVAMRIPSRRLKLAAEAVSRHSSVGHNYQRRHHYNLWFTLSLPNEASLDEELGGLAAEVKPADMLDLPALRVFKLDAFFDLQGQTYQRKSEVRQTDEHTALGAEQWLVVEALQQDIPLVSRPFDSLATCAGMTAEVFLSECRTLLETGTMRRFGASIRHTEAGFAANALVVWNVPQDGVEDAGRHMASFAGVSHCYERKPSGNWRWNMFTMVHGRTRKGCLETIEGISEKTGVRNYEVLFTVREFKKTRTRYLNPASRQRSGRYYPVSLDVAGRRCVVVGGGEVALRKANALLESGAAVEVVSPELCPELERLVAQRAVKARCREYRSADVTGAFLVIAATDDSRINARVSKQAAARKILANVVDAPQLSSFIVPSCLRRGDLAIAVSTGGRSPALARAIREKLERDFGSEYGSVVRLVNSVRSELGQHGIPVSAERWQEALDVDALANLVQEGRMEEAKKRLLDSLRAGQ